GRWGWRYLKIPAVQQATGTGPVGMALRHSDADYAMTQPPPLRVILAKVGLDGHDRGIQIVARGLRDAGFHVIYAGLWQTPEAVVQAALDEDVDWLGISLLSGAHMTLVPRVLELLRMRGLDDVGVIIGGIIPSEDASKLFE